MQGMAEPLLGLRPLSPTLQRDTRSEKQVEEGPTNRDHRITSLGPAPEALAHPPREPGRAPPWLSGSLP